MFSKIIIAMVSLLSVASATNYSFDTLSGSFFAAIGVAIDKSLNKYVLDSGNYPNKVYKLDQITKAISTLDIFSSISAANFVGIATDNKKNLLYVVDSFNINIGGGNRKVYQTDLSGKNLLSIPGPNGPDGAGFVVPISVAVDSISNVYVVDSYNQCIYKYNGLTTTTIVITNGVSLVAPTGIDIDSAGNLYVVDRGASKVYKITPKGVATSLPGPSGPNGAGYYLVYGVAVDINGNVFVCSYGSNHIYKIDIVNNIALQITEPSKGYGTYLYGEGKQLGYLATIKFDSNNNLYASANSVVYKITLTPTSAIKSISMAPVPMSSFVNIK